MNIDLVEIKKDDMVMIHHCIGNIPSDQLDAYVEPILEKLTTLFGKGHIAFFPVREGNQWDFTVIRKS